MSVLVFALFGLALLYGMLSRSFDREAKAAARLGHPDLAAVARLGVRIYAGLGFLACMGAVVVIVAGAS